MLFARIQLTRPLGGVLRALRLSPLVDAVDKALAKYRKRLGRFVPERRGAIPKVLTISTTFCASSSDM